MSSSPTILSDYNVGNIIVPINGTGYGVAGTAIAKAFIEYRKAVGYGNLHGLTINCIGGKPSFETKEDEEIIAPYLKTDPNPDKLSFVFWHAGHLDSLNVPHRDMSVAYTSFEVDGLSAKEVDSLGKFCTIATTTTYHAGILRTYFTQTPKVLVIPHGSTNLNIGYNPNIEPYKIWSQKLGIPLRMDTLVLSSIGKYEKRKGFYKLLDMAQHSKYPGPTLILASWHNPFFNFPFDELHSRGFRQVPSNGYTVYALNNLKVVLLPPTKTRRELIQRAILSHGFISVSHGEGWNLPLAEMYETGIPIITSLSNVIDYLDLTRHEYCIPIEEHVITSAKDGIFFHGTHNWFDFSLDSITKEIAKLHNTVFDQTCKNSIGPFRELASWITVLGRYHAV